MNFDTTSEEGKIECIVFETVRKNRTSFGETQVARSQNTPNFLDLGVPHKDVMQIVKSPKRRAKKGGRAKVGKVLAYPPLLAFYFFATHVHLNEIIHRQDLVLSVNL